VIGIGVIQMLSVWDELEDDEDELGERLLQVYAEHQNAFLTEGMSL
jgi:hypothetical protein